MCLCCYPTHHFFQYFFIPAKGTDVELNVSEVRLAEDYQKDMELAESIFRGLIAESSTKIDNND